MGISPYEVRMIPLVSSRFSCTDCVVHRGTTSNVCAASETWICNGYAIPKIVHKLTGLLVTEPDMVKEYQKHKEEFGQ